MGDIDQCSFLEANLTRLLGWIAAADAKVRVVFAIDVAMLAVIAALAPKAEGTWPLAAAVCSAITLALQLTSLVSLSLTSFPRTSGPAESLVYFGSIAERGVEQFRAAVAGLSEEAYINDLERIRK